MLPLGYSLTCNAACFSVSNTQQTRTATHGEQQNCKPERQKRCIKERERPGRTASTQPCIQYTPHPLRPPPRVMRDSAPLEQATSSAPSPSTLSAALPWPPLSAALPGWAGTKGPPPPLPPRRSRRPAPAPGAGARPAAGRGPCREMPPATAGGARATRAGRQSSAAPRPAAGGGSSGEGARESRRGRADDMRPALSLNT